MKKLFVLMAALVFSLFTMNLGDVYALTGKEMGLKSPFQKVHSSSSYTRLASDNVIEKEPNNTVKKANSLGLKQWGVGVFGEPKDVDYYKIKVGYYGYLYVIGTTKKGESIDFSLYNSKKKSVDMKGFISEDGVDSQLYAVSPGTYYIKVKDSGALKSNETYAVAVVMTGPSIKKVGDSDTKISGKGDPGSTVYVKINNKVVKKKGTKVTVNGNYSLQIDKQKAGTKVTVWATWLEGEKSYQSMSVKTTVKDVTAPKTLTVSKVKSSSKVVSGKTEAKAKVQVKVESKVLGKATADKNGKYKVSIKKQKKNTKLSIVATDKAGNAKTVKVTVK